jgi:transcription termination factor Rho
MELTLSRDLANSRIFPALNIEQSGTRKEELLLKPRELNAARTIRRHLINMPPAQAMKHLIEALSRTKTNDEMFTAMKL